MSMTGYGEAHRRAESVSVEAQVRTVNNRHFKLAVRTSEGYSALEGQIEGVVRRDIRRGSVQVNVYVEREPKVDDYRVNLSVLEGYRRQLTAAIKADDGTPPIRLEALLTLPGVVDERPGRRIDAQADWPVIEAALREALGNMSRMRGEEGRAMEADLRSNAGIVSTELGQIETRAPQVIVAYRERLAERIGSLMAEYNVTMQSSDVVREVGLFAERADVSEEIVRLRSHLEQFEATLGEPESAGRKLDFLVQEMFREANTIGAKANDALIARHVVELKTAIERMREMIQNVE